MSGTANDKEQEYTRHPEFWFSDGSVILRAGSILFRVHMSQLCRKSLFFRDLFSLPQPSSEERDERIEGCPVLDLHDPQRDVINLVKVIYDGPNFTNNDREDFVNVSGVLRLVNKYNVQDAVRNKILDHLCLAWPPTLKGWDAREDIARSYEVETGELRGLRFPNPIAVINLANEIGAYDLLPAAFYDLSRYSYAQIFEPGPGDPFHPGSSPSTASIPHTLSSSDMQRLALGKETAQHAITTLIQNMEHASSERPHRSRLHGHGRGRGRGHTPTHSQSQSRSATNVPAPCVTPAACRKDLCELMELAKEHYLMDRERGCADPLYVAEELGQLKSAEFSDCAACARDLEAWAARERERLWKAVPDWFRLR
ncbi:hypothetical protein C8Q79DRAFT_913476 [Trametes meyenii]|nr:hypothetical protein C8Q79DRAFT_913476 [Trametes meyenii]